MTVRAYTLAVCGALLLAALWSPAAFSAAAGETPQLLRATGALPAEGRVVIRSSLAWLDETNPTFAALSGELAGALAARGLRTVGAPPSRLDPLPKGIDALRGAPPPELGRRGRRQRALSMQEAVARMQAMQLAREGRLPQTRFATGDAAPAGVSRAGNRTASARDSAPASKARPPVLTGPELIRFALSQEEGAPSLRGQVDIPGRIPRELRQGDPEIADYALLARFAMLWPAESQEGSAARRPAIAAGWHLLELACYDLAPARSGKEPRRIWTATVQRVAQGPLMRFSIPAMGREAVLEKNQ